jgi:putative transposase
VVPRCVVHLVRNALRPVARRDAGQVAAELRTIYTAPTAEAAFDALAAFAASQWGRKYPQAAKVFEAAWDAFTRSWPSARPCAGCSAPPTPSRA